MRHEITVILGGEDLAALARGDTVLLTLGTERVLLRAEADGLPMSIRNPEHRCGFCRKVGGHLDTCRIPKIAAANRKRNALMR
jgi:hypothetical protein